MPSTTNPEGTITMTTTWHPNSAFPTHITLDYADCAPGTRVDAVQILQTCDLDGVYRILMLAFYSPDPDGTPIPCTALYGVSDFEGIALLTRVWDDDARALHYDISSLDAFRPHHAD